MRSDQIGLQTYTVRRPAADDLPATLGAVAAAGFRSVELAALPDLPASQLHAELDTAGITAVASHESIETLRAGPEAVLERLATLGCRRAIVPWLPEADRTNPAAVRRFVDELTRLGEQCARHGVTLGYHNHAFEFQPLDGTSVWEILVDELPPEVDFELDVYWAARAEQDPVALIRDLAGRVSLLHMKDMAPGAERRDAPAGHGVLPWPEIVSAAGRAGVEWYIVEQDEPIEPIEDSARALRFLESLATESGGPSSS